ncbi:MAG: HAMP domain-containing protein, partial [Gallionella sp.]
MTGNSASNKLMQAFFSPAAALMNRLNVSGKFTLLGLMSLVAIAVVVYSLFASLDQIISFSQRELRGLELVKPFPRVVQALQQHRGLSAEILGGDETMRDSQASMEREVAKALGGMREQQFSGMASGEVLQHIRADWERLSKDGPGWTAAENFAAHTRLIDRIQAFEVVVADEYALTLDPELSTYYLIDTIVNKLPHALEHLGRLRAYGTGILTSKQVTPQQRIELNILIAELDDAVWSLHTNLDKTGRYNPALQGLISAASGDITDSAQQVSGLVVSDILAGRFATHHNDFFGMSTAAIDRSYTQLYKTLLPTAETLIKARITRAENVLHASIGIAFLLFLIVAYFSIGICRAIIVNIRSLARSAHAFADGDLSERVNLDARDELGQVGENFNEMADGLSALLKASRENEARLHDLSVHLEERVKERTTELEFAQRLTESLLRRNEALMMTSMDGIHVMDLNGSLVAANDAFCRMLGYTQADVHRLGVTDWDTQWPLEELQS